MASSRRDWRLLAGLALVLTKAALVDLWQRLQCPGRRRRRRRRGEHDDELLLAELLRGLPRAELEHAVKRLAGARGLAGVTGCRPLHRGFHSSAYRIEWASGTDGHRAPFSVVLKLWKPHGWQQCWLWAKASWQLVCSAPHAERLSRHAQYLRSFVVEAQLYSSPATGPVLRAAGAPRLFYEHTSLGRSGSLVSALLLEDISALPGSWFRAEGFPLAEAQLLLAALAAFHARFLNKKLSCDSWDEGGYWCGRKRPLTEPLDAAWRLVECQHRSRWSPGFVRWLSGLETDPGTELDAALRDGLEKDLAQLQPQTMVHGDWKVNNLFVLRQNGPPEQRVRVLDWQWSGAGSVAVDVAHFFCTSLHPSVHSSPRSLDELLVHYHTHLRRCSSATQACPDLIELRRQTAAHVVRFVQDTVCFKWPGLTPADMDRNAAEGMHGLDRRHYPTQERNVRMAVEFARWLRRVRRGDSTLHEWCGFVTGDQPGAVAAG